MKRSSLLFAALVALLNSATAQRKVLLEDFTGAYCANCPFGVQYVDSMMGLFPDDLIVVSLHSYGIHDSMFFPTIDTLGMEYAGGAPLGAIDRLYNVPASAVAIFPTQWQAMIQQRIAAAPKVDVNVTTAWDSATRDITATVSVDILSDIDSGDYRIGLYVVEDSVMHTGNGYDQSNIYNTQVGNPYYGMGDPIVGFTHRHVVRAMLPYTWGQAGVISATPTTGQNYAKIFHYTLPPSYNEHKVSLVGFVSAFSSSHQQDSILNAAGEKLSIMPSTAVRTYNKGDFSIYPNPSSDVMTFAAADNKSYMLWLCNTLGQVVLKKELKGAVSVRGDEVGNNGMYYAKIIAEGRQVASATVSFLK